MLRGDPTLLSDAVLQRPNACVFDFDGTLAPIRRNPDAVRVSRERLDLLQRLVAAFDLVAVISGRSRRDIAHRLEAPGLLVIGGHGNEWSDGVRYQPEPGWRRSAEDAARAVLDRIPAARIESKPSSLVVHFRGLDVDQASVEEIVRSRLHAGLTMRRARRGIEIAPAGAPTKGSALRDLVAAGGLRGLVVCGDDVTDWEMFETAHDLRRRGTAAVAALVRSRETPAGLPAPEIEVAGLAGVDQLMRSILVLARRARRSPDRGAVPPTRP